MVRPSSVCTIESAISIVRKQTTGETQTLACEERDYHTTELLRPSLASTGNSSQAPVSKTLVHTLGHLVLEYLPDNVCPRLLVDMSVQVDT
jgi:hypothetical protein